MGRNYTGKAFLDDFTATWHISLAPREKLTFGQEEPEWFSSGISHPSTTSQFSVAAYWDTSGDLMSLACTAGAKAPRRDEFLRGCVRLDHPGAQPESAVTWLDGMRPRVDTAFAATAVKINGGAKGPTETHLQVKSPLFWAGPTATYLSESPRSGANYSILIFGADPDAE